MALNSKNRPTPKLRRWLRIGHGLALATTLGISGCATLGKRDNTAINMEPRLTETPTAKSLISYLDRNASLLPAVEARDLDIDIKAGSQSFGLGGSMFVQQPKNFRLRAKIPALGKQVADVGSNDQEFWYWISEDRPPYLYHCNHSDLARGVKLPFPIQPEWVMEAMGLATHDTSNLANFRVEVNGDTLDLIEQAVTPQGERVQKVTTFRNANTNGSAPQVTGMRLVDASGKTVCTATIESVHRFQVDSTRVAVLPHKVKLEWPAFQMGLKVTLPADGLKLNGAANDIATNRQIFSRPVMKDVRAFDLARQNIDSPANFQRTGGFGR